MLKLNRLLDIGKFLWTVKSRHDDVFTWFFMICLIFCTFNSPIANWTWYNLNYFVLYAILGKRSLFFRMYWRNRTMHIETFINSPWLKWTNKAKAHRRLHWIAPSRGLVFFCVVTFKKGSPLAKRRFVDRPIILLELHMIRHTCFQHRGVCVFSTTTFVSYFSIVFIVNNSITF